MAAGLAESYAGLSNIESIPVEQRIYDRDKKIVEYAKGRLSMTRILMKKFAESGKVAATDMHVKYKADIARQAQLTLAADSGNWGGVAPDEDMFEFADAYAEYIDVGAVLVIQDNYVWNNGGNLAYTGTPASGRTSKERCLVLAKGISDGTNTPFQVQRGWQATCGGTWTEGNNLSSGDTVLVLPKSQQEGSNEARVWGDTPHEDYNYCEIALEKWGQTTLSRNVNIYQDEPLSVRNGRRTLDLYYKKFELKLLFGQRYSDVVNGRRRWWTGGLDEYIEEDQATIGYDGSDNIIDFTTTYGAVSSQTLNTFGNNKFQWGNTEEKFWIMDSVAYTKIANAFDNKVRIIYNPTLSLKYGIRINDLEISGGGVFHLVLHDLFTIYGLSNFSYIVDFDYMKYMHLQNEDLMILMNVEKGMNIFEEVNYLYMNSGLLRRNPFAHYKVYNL